MPAEYSSAPSIWVDAMRVSMRQDGLATLVFQTVHPERDVLLEAARLQTTAAHLRAMIQVLESSLQQHAPTGDAAPG